MADRLETYRQKRDFKKTAEPAGLVRPEGGRRYLIQKHDATRLHYDFRLENHGVLLSWAVTRGPSLDTADRRLAVHVEDHPLDYGDFEGTIPKGEYGGGTVMLWDEGTWEPVGDPDAGIAKGELKMVLNGERLKGKFVLVRLKRRPGERSKAENWLLIKERDDYAGPEKEPIVERALTSVRTGRTMEEIAAGNVEWTRSGRRVKEAGGNGAAEAGTKVGAIKPRPQKLRVGARRPAKGPSEPPKFISPELATLVEDPPEGAGWVHEIKFDGYRLIAAVGGGRAITYTRKGLDWSARFHTLVQPLADLPCSSALLDGEAVVMDDKGRSDFGALQVALGVAEGSSAQKGRITYHVFDLMHLDGEDLRSLPLVERKAKLKALLADQPETGSIFYSDHVEGHGKEFFKQAEALKLEGIISKRADSQYRSERSKAWLKIKANDGQEFIIVGWQPSTVKKRPFSAIVLATRDENRLVYRGRVGSGFSGKTLDDLSAKFAPLETDKSPIPLDEVPAEGRKGTHWLKPELVAEIEFRGWTGEKYIRQGAYKGLRADKKPAEIVREEPAALPAEAKGRARVKETKPAKKTRASAARERTQTNIDKAPAVVRIDTDRDHGTLTIEGVRVTHPERVLFPGEKITKRMLIDYYVSIADRILPHLADRPLSLVRFPDGAEGDGFYQKHASRGFPEQLLRVPIQEKNKTEDYLYIHDVQGLVAAAQMGALELHVWGSHVKTLENPDRVVFDFDPDEAVSFDTVKESAVEMRDRLKSIGLTSFAMTTGGKGIHVVLPLTPHHGWEDIRAFAEAMARTFAAENPNRYLAEMSKAARKGRIFIDYLRNARGSTAISPFSTRARKGAPIAWPVAWTALSKLPSAHEVTALNVGEVKEKKKKDPWAGYFDVDQVLPMEKLRSN